MPVDTSADPHGLESDVFTVTGQCLPFPAEVWGFSLASNGPVNIDIFDGFNASARKRMAFNDSNANGMTVMPAKPFHFAFGLFIVVNAGNPRLTIMYRALVGQK